MGRFDMIVKRYGMLRLDKTTRCRPSATVRVRSDVAQVLEKIMPINESGSDPFWVNDTIEVFRVCPEYGAQDANEVATIIGRNFRDSDVLACRFTTCTSTSAGSRNCDDQAASAKSVRVAATYISSTRVQCPMPAYSFPSNASLLFNEGVCEYDDAGTLAYVQNCELDTVSDGSCEDDAGVGNRFVYGTLVSASYLSHSVRTIGGVPHWPCEVTISTISAMCRDIHQ